MAPKVTMGGNSVFINTAGINFLDGTTQITTAGSAPAGSGNKIVATPADGSLGTAIPRKMVSADLPNFIDSGTF